MTLEEFMAQVRKETDKFEKHWVEENKKNADQYPNEMEQPDWYENFTIFIQDESGD